MQRSSSRCPEVFTFSGSAASRVGAAALMVVLNTAPTIVVSTGQKAGSIRNMSRRDRLTRSAGGQGQIYQAGPIKRDGTLNEAI